ncbi:MAG: amino acid permease [Sphingomonas sp.]|nr:amino acid permease [Sphingomonas sp.]
MTREIQAPPRQIGFWTCLALVVGNTIGTGIFLLPAALAPFGWNALYGWGITIGGGLCLAYVFAALARQMPEAGGPYDYIAGAFGPMAGFFVMWSYWISQWVTNAAIGIGIVSYLAPFAPEFFARPAIGPLVAIGFVILMTTIALRGVRASGSVQIVTTVLKLLPLIAVVMALLIVLGSGGSSAAMTANVAPTPVGGPAIAGAAALALWAMLGFESGTIPAGRVIDPARTIARATMIGTLFVGIVYVLVTFAVFLLLPSDVAANSTAPLADLIDQIWGTRAGQLVAAFAAISALGALNGWVFLQAEVPMVLAERGVFPKIFARVNDAGMPVFAHVVGCSLSVALIAMNLSSGMIQIYSFIVLLATVATLVLYLAGALAMLAFLKRGQAKGVLAAAAALIGATYAIWTFYGAGAEATGWGAVLLATGIPVYFLMRSRAGSSPVEELNPAAPPGSSS